MFEKKDKERVKKGKRMEMYLGEDLTDLLTQQCRLETMVPTTRNWKLSINGQFTYKIILRQTRCRATDFVQLVMVINKLQRKTVTIIRVSFSTIKIRWSIEDSKPKTVNEVTKKTLMQKRERSCCLLFLCIAAINHFKINENKTNPVRTVKLSIKMLRCGQIITIICETNKNKR